MVLAEGDHVVADSSSIVGSIGVVFQKMKLKGLFDHFNLDFKSVTTNEYIKSHTANLCRIFLLQTETLHPRSRLILNKYAKEDMRNSLPR